jgi:hypothetical protein
MFRFSTTEQAARALAAIERDYLRHCRAARAIAEDYFDARSILARVADLATGPAMRSKSNRGEHATTALLGDEE